MKWSPPRIEHRRSHFRFPVLAAFFAGALSGCASGPVVHRPSAAPGSRELVYTAEEKKLLAAMPRVPEFDLPEKTTLESRVASNSSSLNVAVPSESTSAARASESGALAGSAAVATKPQGNVPVGTTMPDTSATVTTTPKVAAPTQGAANPSKIAASEPAKSDIPSKSSPAPAGETPKKTDLAKATNAAKPSDPAKPSDSAKTEQKASKPTGIAIAAPKPFSWSKDGKSTGDRPFLTATIGDDGYRTLVVGSVGGDDAVALELTDQLARRLHEDSVILGGFQCRIVRTLNPDGEANRRTLNEKGQYVNSGFPQQGKSPADQPVEVKWLLNQMEQLQPQRIVHIRSVEGSSGLIAASYSAQPVAKEAAEWVRFKLVMLPESARNPGSLERYVSTQGNAEIITFGVPDATPPNEAWDRYGDALMNMLIGDDVATRELARQQSRKSSADRRNQLPGK